MDVFSASLYLGSFHIRTIYLRRLIFVDPSALITFYNPSKPSVWEPIELDADGYIEPLYVTVCETRVKILLRIVHSDEAIHHEIQMEWSGKGSASTISDRRVEVVVDINQVGDGKYAETVIRAKQGTDSLKSYKVGGKTGSRFLILGQTKPLTAKDEIAHANRVVADYWYSILSTKVKFWGKEAVLAELEPMVKRLLLINLTDVYIADQ